METLNNMLRTEHILCGKSIIILVLVSMYIYMVGLSIVTIIRHTIVHKKSIFTNHGESVHHDLNFGVILFVTVHIALFIVAVLFGVVAGIGWFWNWCP